MPVALRVSQTHRPCRALTIAILGAVFACGAGGARADDRPGHQSLSLDRGALRVSASVEVGLDRDSAGAPVSLAPDVYVGLTSRLTLGLVHSGSALGLLNSGWGFCLTGRTGGCDRVVSGTGYDGWYTFWRSHRLELAARARLYVARLYRRFKLRSTLGLRGVLRAGPMALHFDPHLSVGLFNRSEGNADTLNVPIHLYVALGSYVAIYLRTGLQGQLRGFSDQYAVPLGLGVVVRPTARWRLGAQFVLRQILGPLNTYRKRDLLLYADYRFTSLF